MTRYCVDCDHHMKLNVATYGGGHHTEHHCSSDRRPRDLVTGKPIESKCSVLRGPQYCGQYGDWFTPKKEQT